MSWGMGGGGMGGGGMGGGGMGGAQQSTLIIDVTAACTGLIIGKKGAEVNKMKKDYGVDIKIPKQHEINGPNARITITGRDVNGCGQRISDIVTKPDRRTGQANGQVTIVQGGGGMGGAAMGGAAIGGAGGFGSPGGGGQPVLKEHVAVKQHGAAITGILLMGSDLYSVAKDGKIIVWQYDGNNLTPKTSVDTSGPAECLLAVGPFLFAGVPGGIQCWNMTTNAQQNIEHPPLVHCLASCEIANVGPVLLSGGEDGNIRVWNKNQQDQWMGVTELKGHTAGAVRSIEVANNAVPGTQVIISGGQDNTCRLWTLAPNPTCVQTLSEAQGWVMSALEMVIGPQTYVCTGSLDTKIKVYQVQGAQFTPLHQHDVFASVQQESPGITQDACQVTSMLMTEDPQGTPVLAVALCGGVIMVYDVPAFTKRCQLTCGPPGGTIALMALPKQLLVAGAADGQVYMWKW